MIDLDRDIDAVAAAAAVGQLQARMTLLPVSPSSQHPAWLDPKEASYLKWIGVGKTKGEAGDGEPARKPIHRAELACFSHSLIFRCQSSLHVILTANSH